MHLTAGFVISNVVFVHDYGNGHQLTKDVDMVTLQRRLLFEKGGVNWSSLVSCMSVTGLPCGSDRTVRDWRGQTGAGS